MCVYRTRHYMVFLPLNSSNSSWWNQDLQREKTQFIFTGGCYPYKYYEYIGLKLISKMVERQKVMFFIFLCCMFMCIQAQEHQKTFIVHTDFKWFPCWLFLCVRVSRGSCCFKSCFFSRILCESAGSSHTVTSFHPPSTLMGHCTGSVLERERGGRMGVAATALVENLGFY